MYLYIKKSPTRLFICCNRIAKISPGSKIFTFPRSRTRYIAEPSSLRTISGGPLMRRR